MLLGRFFLCPPAFFFYCFFLVSSRKVGNKKKKTLSILIAHFVHAHKCVHARMYVWMCVCVCVNPVVRSITGLECVSGPFVNDRLPKSQSTFLLLLLLAFLHPLALSLRPFPPSLLHLLADPSVMTVPSPFALVPRLLLSLVGPATPVSLSSATFHSAHYPSPWM